MQLALRADSYGHDPSAASQPSTRRSAKALVAGVAVASAGVIAVNPVTPTLPDLQERAVQLSAFANPLVEWQQTISTTFELLQRLGTGTAASVGALTPALLNPELFAEVANIIRLNATNPLPLLTSIINLPATHGNVVGPALENTLAGLSTALQNFPTMVVNTLNYLAQGKFVEAFAEADTYFVLQILGGLRPLIPLFSIPSDIIEGIPGAERLPAVFDVISEFALAKAVFAPVLGAVGQAAEIFDAVQAAAATGDMATAVSELVNLPAKVFNALVNGYTPGFSTSPWPGLINGGVVDYLLVTLPKQIAAALTPAPTATLAAQATTVAPAAATDATIGGGDTVTLSVDSATSTTTDTTAPAPEGEAGAGATTEDDESDVPAEDEGTGEDESDTTDGGSTEDDADDSATDTDDEADDADDNSDSTGSDDDSTQGGTNSGAADGDSDSDSDSGSGSTGGSGSDSGSGGDSGGSGSGSGSGGSGSGGNE